MININKRALSPVWRVQKNLGSTEGERPMIVIACVDDRMGMLFNRRRQSQDAALRQRLL